MTLSAKWTAVSFLALTAVATGSFAFAGCTATTGNPTDTEGGTGNPPVDSGTKTDSAVAAKCEGNDKQTHKLSDACQAALNAECCAELKGCFNLVVDPDAGGGRDDCNAYADCSALALKQATMAEQEAAQKECDLNAPQSVQDAFTALETCQTDKPGPNAACQ